MHRWSNGLWDKWFLQRPGWETSPLDDYSNARVMAMCAQKSALGAVCAKSLGFRYVWKFQQVTLGVKCNAG